MQFDENKVFGSCGRYTMVWDHDAQQVQIWDTREGVALQHSDEPDLSEAASLIDNEEGEAGPLSKEEIFFLLDCLTCLEQNYELAPYDLDRFGRVGISG